MPTETWNSDSAEKLAQRKLVRCRVGEGEVAGRHGLEGGLADDHGRYSRHSEM
jgi:hypothetical protein